jgi:glycosyltransferase involved in cell wall biosynthesis
VTTNERQRDFFVREGASREKALIASNGVDDALLDSLRPRECPSPPSTPLSVAYVGLLGIVQGIGVLADAAQLLPQTEWMFSVAGEGPERESIARRAANAKLCNFQLMGYVDEHEIVRILQESDVLYAQLRGVAASASAVPSKLFEYMAAGKPIVFGGTGAGADLVRRAEAGIVIPPDDPDALANALSALKDGDLRSRLGESGRRFAEANRRSTIVAELVERIEAIGADRWNEHPRSSGSAAAAGAASQIGEDDPAVE